LSRSFQVSKRPYRTNIRGVSMGRWWELMEFSPLLAPHHSPCQLHKYCDLTVLFLLSIFTLSVLFPRDSLFCLIALRSTLTSICGCEVEIYDTDYKTSILIQAIISYMAVTEADTDNSTIHATAPNLTLRVILCDTPPSHSGSPPDYPFHYPTKTFCHG
jgi:hypothetical protein